MKNKLNAAQLLKVKSSVRAGSAAAESKKK